MPQPPATTAHPSQLDDDASVLAQLGYVQELSRTLGAFSNFAISLSIICILAGGITSFHIGYCSVGGAAIGLGWPLVCVFSLAVALSMAQIASAFPTAGGLYHWGAILGGKGCGWATAWFNLAGLVTVLAAINVGTYRFLAAARSRGWSLGRPILVRHCRVGILNHIGKILSPRVALLLVGERPGLRSTDSLSAYMAHRPAPHHTDAHRNLVSNIHAAGTPPERAAERIAALAAEMMRLETSGPLVKEVLRQEATLVPTAANARTLPAPHPPEHPS
jgi:hypothetical protein